jgi:hypothetical protein
MCDYSLAELSTRLAAVGEHLLVHRFATGSIGLKCSRRRLREVLFPYMTVAVCIPPGARLYLQDIPGDLQERLGIGSAETVKFIQRGFTEFTHRDGVRFANGREALLQELQAGQRVTVLSLESEVEASSHRKGSAELSNRP